MSVSILGKPVSNLYIGGQWREGRSDRVLKNTNPYDGSLIFELRQANKADLDDAYRVAAEAQPAWEAMGPSERAAIISRAADLLDENRAEFVDLLVREAGATVLKANIEIDLAIGMTREAATFPARMHGKIFNSDVPNREMRVYRKALGVVGVISPWNFPLHLTQRSVAPALATGNAVVIKPASDTPITGGLMIARLFEEAGVPAGVLSVVIGAGSEIGDDFVAHEVPKLISFTGSTPVGKRVGVTAIGGDHLKKVALELGGNAPLTILSDADLGAAVEAATVGAFLNSGQICMSTNRIIVEDAIYDDFVAAYVEAVKTVKFGDPTGEGVLVGPVINDTQLETVKGKIALAQEEGAKLAVGGDVEGRVIPPHVFTDVTPDMELAREEIFGPVVGILRARDEDHALEIANNHQFGLSSAVFTQNIDRGEQYAKKNVAGMTFLNDMTVQDEAHVAFGGERNSGLGRFNGEWIMNEFTTEHTIGVRRI